MTDRIHPYVVHFSVALVLMSVLLFFIGTVARRRAWAAEILTVARWNLWIGSGFALASIGTGFVDYLSARCDVDMIGATILHRRSGAAMWWSSLIASVAVYRTRHRAPGPVLLGWLALVAAAALTATFLGTGLTYDRGLGVSGMQAESAELCFALERAVDTP